MCQLSGAQKSYHQQPILIVLDKRISGLIGSDQILYSAWPGQYISPDENTQGRQVENFFLNTIRLLWLQGDTIWSVQCSNKLPELSQQDSSRKYWCYYDFLSGQHLDLYWWCHAKSRWCSVINFQATEKILALYQSEEIPISSGWDLFFLLCSILARYSYKKWENHYCIRLAWATVDTRHPRVF